MGTKIRYQFVAADGPNGAGKTWAHLEAFVADHEARIEAETDQAWAEFGAAHQDELDTIGGER